MTIPQPRERFNGGIARRSSGALLVELERQFRHVQFVEQLADLEATCQRNVGTAKFGDSTKAVGEALRVALVVIDNSRRPGAEGLLAAGIEPSSMKPENFTEHIRAAQPNAYNAHSNHIARLGIAVVLAIASTRIYSAAIGLTWALSRRSTTPTSS